MLFSPGVDDNWTSHRSTSSSASRSKPLFASPNSKVSCLRDKKIIKCFWSINLISDNNLVFHLFFSCYFDPRFQMFPLGLSHFFKLWEFIKKGHHIPYGKRLTIYQIITQWDRRYFPRCRHSMRFLNWT